MLNPWNLYKQLPTFIQALIAAVVSMMFNITVLVLLFIGLSTLINKYEGTANMDVLGVSTHKVVEMFNK